MVKKAKSKRKIVISVSPHVAGYIVDMLDTEMLTDEWNAFPPAPEDIEELKDKTDDGLLAWQHATIAEIERIAKLFKRAAKGR